jgi:uncharacterized protein (DUF4213/DUF364 family)
MVPKGCPETSVGNYHCLLLNNPEERSYQFMANVKRLWVSAQKSHLQSLLEQHNTIQLQHATLGITAINALLQFYNS